MKRLLVLAVIVAVVLTGAYTVLTVYDDNLKVGRMWETPAVKPHENELPVMEAGVVPFDGGEVLFRLADENTLAAPPDMTGVRAVNGGETAYYKFCAQCHGKTHDGNGTVGQSFHPLPADLRSARVQSMKPGRMFKEISYGVPGGRQPALATTIAAADRWAVIAYLKSLGVR